MHLSAWTHTRSTMAVCTHFHTSLWKNGNRFFAMKDRREKSIPLKNKCEESCETPHSVGLILPSIITQSIVFSLETPELSLLHYFPRGQQQLCHWWGPLIFFKSEEQSVQLCAPLERKLCGVLRLQFSISGERWISIWRRQGLINF